MCWLSKGWINSAKFLCFFHEDVLLLLMLNHVMQVVARWNTSCACRPVLDESPVYRPTEEVFFFFKVPQCIVVILQMYFFSAYHNPVFSFCASGISGHLKIY
jgi:hypothetical protein